MLYRYNRNFTGRNDANTATHAFVASPDIVTAMVFGGSLTFNPVTDSLKGADGKEFKFSDPSGKELPPRGYDAGENTYQAPPSDRASVSVAVDPKSDRLQLLEPFKPWDGKDPQGLPVLIKAVGKCTTDHSAFSPPLPALAFPFCVPSRFLYAPWRHVSDVLVFANLQSRPVARGSSTAVTCRFVFPLSLRFYLAAGADITTLFTEHLPELPYWSCTCISRA